MLGILIDHCPPRKEKVQALKSAGFEIRQSPLLPIVADAESEAAAPKQLSRNKLLVQHCQKRL